LRKTCHEHTSNSDSYPSYGASALITATRLDENAELIQGQTSGNLGEFDLSLAPNATYVLRISGAYFSETLGIPIDQGISLAAVVQSRTGEAVNVNVATHLSHRRVQALIEDGMETGTALDNATGELVLALSSLLPAPSNPLVFSQLAVINAAQQMPNQEGNAWLLALSALVEIAGGTNVGDLLNSLALDFATDGVLDTDVINKLEAAIGNVNPDSILDNLIKLEPAFINSALVTSGAFTADQVAQASCRVFSSTLLCIGAETLPTGSLDSALGELEPNSSQSIDVSAVVADINQFIDTDRDGLVNSIDTDDDNDGIADTADTTPYNN
jgi:hypothetical protein